MRSLKESCDTCYLEAILCVIAIQGFKYNNQSKARSWRVGCVLATSVVSITNGPFTKNLAIINVVLPSEVAFWLPNVIQMHTAHYLMWQYGSERKIHIRPVMTLGDIIVGTWILIAKAFFLVRNLMQHILDEVPQNPSDNSYILDYVSLQLPLCQIWFLINFSINSAVCHVVTNFILPGSLKSGMPHKFFIHPFLFSH